MTYPTILVTSTIIIFSPDLSWRDVQYLLAYTSNTARLVNGNWVTNGGNLRVSNEFGFGAIDVEALVSRGRHWTNVPMQHSITIGRFIFSQLYNGNSSSFDSFYRSDPEIVSLEHVVVIISLNFDDISQELYNTYAAALENGEPVTWPERGQIQITLTSPSGTISTILPTRDSDKLPGNYTSWPLMSVHFWGENPVGTWTVRIYNLNNVGSVQVTVDISHFVFYGTSQVQAVSQIPTQCSSECDPTRGCAGSGAEFCDACAELRISFTLECTSSCPEGTTERSGYCHLGAPAGSLPTESLPTGSLPTESLPTGSLPTESSADSVSVIQWVLIIATFCSAFIISQNIPIRY